MPTRRHPLPLPLAAVAAFGVVPGAAPAMTQAQPAPPMLQMPLIPVQVPAADPAGWTAHRVGDITLLLPDGFGLKCDEPDRVLFFGDADTGFREVEFQLHAGAVPGAGRDFARCAREGGVSEHPGLEAPGHGPVTVMELHETREHRGEMRHTLNIAGIVAQRPEDGPGFVVWLTDSGSLGADVEDERALLLAVLSTLTAVAG